MRDSNRDEAKPMKRARYFGAILWLVLALGSPVPGAQKSDGSSPTHGKPPAEAMTQATVAGRSDPEYKIGALDVLRVDVWKEPEISRLVPVRPDGKISLPLLNDVQAAGLTAMQLAANIREGLTKFLNGPQVTVTVTQINSRRVFVTGEVAHSGAMPLLPGMTALQALSASGGFTQFAREKSIYILRTENGKQVKHPYNY